MKLGLCLAGGGAKGAFEAGVIKRLYENNLIPSVVTGTSIGAVTAYFLMKDGLQQLEEMWNTTNSVNRDVKADKVIDNSALIAELEKLSGREEMIKSVYVNYVHIENKSLSEVIVNISQCDKRKALDSVKYSSLLPARPERNSEDFDSGKVFEYFKEDVKNGIYEGYNLDGGILNNNLLAPFITDRVDGVIIVGLKDGYTPPDYIYDYYNRDRVFIISPDIKIMPKDTMRFEKNFCTDLLERGYRLSKEVINKIKNICILKV
jgi:predicted acylesterase/phospholipase RssA